MINEEVKIRKYQEKDRQRIHEICLETCTDKYLLENPELLFLLYADYYLDCAPEDVFVATDEKDDCCGYILCSTNSKTYLSQYREKYLPLVKKRFPQKLSLVRAEFLAKKVFGRAYPAHLHIDLSEMIQRQGVGTRLVATLEKHLIEMGIKGVHLGCARQNVKGVNFYTKLGFVPLYLSKEAVIFGKKLNFCSEKV